MNELISEVEKIISTQKQMIARNKKYHEFPFMSDCQHYYRLIILQNTLDVWEGCLKLLLKYKKDRCSDFTYKSTMFERMFEVEMKYTRIFPYKMQTEVVEYMKNLEWQLEAKTNSLSDYQ